jgi:hypothetical protein
MNAQEVVQRVVSALRQRHLSGFLIEVPPGCEEPDVIAEVRRRVLQEVELSAAHSYLPADTVANERDLVELLIGGWLKSSPPLGSRWQGIQRVIESLQPPQRLKAFFSECIEGGERRQIALIGRFDKVFVRMSSELLAVMLNLESLDLLMTVNASPLDYRELYRRRARQQPGFTSTYGTLHPRLTLGPLSRDEALRRWWEVHGLPWEDRISRAHFETAFTLSGGLPVAFAMAANLASSSQPLDPDLRHYRAELISKLPDAFERLLGYDEEDVRPRLVEAVARMHLGNAFPEDRRFVDAHRWRDLLLDENGGEPRLRTESLGRKALATLRHERRAEVSPENLYRQGEFRACCAALQELGAPQERLLFRAAQMLDDVFGDAPKNLYFGPDISWRRIELFAMAAAKACADEPSSQEFERWARIARIQSEAPSGRSDGQPEANSKDPEDDVIRLGIRVLAVKRDRNPVTAAYSAIPLIEDVLRRYVLLVLKLPVNGSAFSQVERSRLESWWRDDSRFNLPEPSSLLNATQLAVLAAARSEERGHRLFDEPREVSRMLTILNEGRNVLSHYVTTPSAQKGRDLSDCAARLLDQLCKHLGSSLTLHEIETWVKPPYRFLEET